MEADLHAIADAVLAGARRRGLRVAVAESCTAGLLALVLSDAEGASTTFAGGFVTYTKAQKQAVLKVPQQFLANSAVSCEVARAMAEGALNASAAELAASITGVAGPEPDDDGNPVGRVCIATAKRGVTASAVEYNYGPLPRDEIRARAVSDALRALMGFINTQSEAA